MASIVRSFSASSVHSQQMSGKFSANCFAKVNRKDAVIIQVAKKLEKHPHFKSLNDRARESKAKNLFDKESLKESFSHLYADSYKTITSALDDDEDLDGFASPTEQAKRQERAEQRMEDMCDLPIKLYLREITISRSALSLASNVSAFLKCQFGPLHAALKVGDVLIEWDNSSLVIPRQLNDLSPDEREFFFMADIRRSSEFHRSASLPKTTDSEVEVLISKNADKVKLLDNLIEVISRYNRKYYYNPVSRNCQKFVLDAAEALGIKDKIIFRSHHMRNHFQELREAGKARGLQQSFQNHAELDAYIAQRDRSGNLEKDDRSSLEYLNAVYFHFHYDPQDEEDGAVPPIPCEDPGCKQPRLVGLLKPRLKKLQAEEDLAAPISASLQVPLSN